MEPKFYYLSLKWGNPVKCRWQTSRLLLSLFNNEQKAGRLGLPIIIVFVIQLRIGIAATRLSDRFSSEQMKAH